MLSSQKEYELYSGLLLNSTFDAIKDKAFNNKL
jgi:hypothetical protein